VVLALLGCSGPRPEHAGGWPWRETRQEYVRRSAVWTGGDPERWIDRMRTLDLRRGPPGRDAFAPEALVRCTYVAPRDPDTFSGHTPKFLCRRDPDDDVFKVKWGAENGEIYADVAGTRLLWALGFPTDRVYPVRVECRGCADDPWDDPAPRPGNVPAPFDPAVAERQFPGLTIEQEPHEGWTWEELAMVDPAAGGAPRAHVDALRLLGAFLQHRDSKADNQRLVCPPDAVVERGGKLDCRRPIMLIDDLGSAFGGPSLIATHKMTLQHWTSRPVWSDPVRCIANVTSELDARDGLDHPQIGEAGRRFLARLLAALDRRQIEALFRAARAERRGGVSRWVAAFERRRREVLRPVAGDPGFRCPD
jgi:hypothetical protein